MIDEALVKRLRGVLKRHGRADTFVRTRVTRAELCSLLDAVERKGLKCPCGFEETRVCCADCEQVLVGRPREEGPSHG